MFFCQSVRIRTCWNSYLFTENPHFHSMIAAGYNGLLRLGRGKAAASKPATAAPEASEALSPAVKRPNFSGTWMLGPQGWIQKMMPEIPPN